jgi:hypothetical protein
MPNKALKLRVSEFAALHERLDVYQNDLDSADT